jgi:hypothetical protein
VLSNTAQTILLAGCSLQGDPPNGLNPMSKYYVLRLEAEFKIIYMDRNAADLWKEAGWELRPHDSNEKAQLAMAEWEGNILKSTPFLVRRQA